MSTDEAGNPGISDGLRMLAPFARDDWARYALSAILATLGTLSQLGTFYIVYRAVVLLIDQSATVEAGDLYRLAFIGMILVIAQYLLMATSTWISHRAAFATLEQLRLRMGERLGRVPLGFITRRRSGEIQRTLIDDVERLEIFLAHAIPDLVSGVAVVLFTTVWLFIVDWRLALATIAVVALAMPIMTIGMNRSMAKMGEHTKSMARMNGSVVEFVRGLPVIRTFNRADDTFTETKEAIEASAQFQSDWGREFLPSFSLFFVLISANILFLMPVGLWLWTTERIETTTLLFFFIVGVGFSAPIMRLMEFFASISHLSFSAKAVLELEEASELPEVSTRVDMGEPTVEVSELSFSHISVDGETRQVLDKCSFVAEPGTVTAIVGPSGSGKTTMAKLLCRFWDIDAGSVHIGGHDVKDMPVEQLMEQVSFVFQDTFLFDDTVAANIALGNSSATSVEIEAAAIAARANEFILALPEGYATMLGERGSRLSGGERQRLAIARAFLKAAPILILDEATAFADPENEAALQDALSALAKGRTLILIAHRLSTIVGADQILVLDAVDGGPGQIVEQGRHQELVKAEGLYARMWAAFESSQPTTLDNVTTNTDSSKGVSR